VAARPSYVPARIQLGVTLLSLGESAAAGEQWRKALEIEPDNVRAKMYLRMVSASLSARPPPVEAGKDAEAGKDGAGGTSA
jgi:hypothetical protein